MFYEVLTIQTPMTAQQKNYNCYKNYNLLKSDKKFSLIQLLTHAL